ncbi:hypothetical protein KIW84_053933 [Lathyrus oleraceus]|uniref:Uncharacterized protein n=1 Tax=Pisum sativum TaxID=3888 RepID=A0A9D4WU02_PEA|nr:hypothetical protein KIW84_053933 [Pisum sativum]
MPHHGAHRVNNVEGEEALDLVVNVDDVQTSLLVVKERLLDGGIFPGCDQGCSDCEDSAKGCIQLKNGIQGLMDEGCLQFARAVKDRGVVSTVTIYFKPSEGRGQRTVNAPATVSAPATISAPVTVSAPTTIVASESQIRPVNQDPVTIGLPIRAPVTVGPVVDNVGGPGGFTRSGRLFAPQPLRDNNAEALAKAKGKQAVVEEEPVQKEALEGSFEKDVEEFMKIIKKSTP